MVALKRALMALMTAETWHDLGHVAGTYDWIAGHPRLLRSLSFGDDDYGACVHAALQQVLYQPAGLETLLAFDGVEAWLTAHAPDEHAALVMGNALAHAAVEHARAAGGDLDIDDHVRRIQAALPADPALALGSTKDLLETVLKHVLGMHGAEAHEDFPVLLARALQALGLHPGSVEGAAPGADDLRRLLGGLMNAALAVNRLRNCYGTGHGRAQAPDIDAPTAQVAVTAGCAFATFVMQRYRRLGGTQ